MNSAYCKGEAKATNKLLELMLSLRKSTVPEIWRSQYATRMSLSLGEWVTDLISRTSALSKKYTVGMKNSADLMKCAFWVGGMFTPEAFVTATRQQTAQVNYLHLFLNYLVFFSSALMFFLWCCYIIFLIIFFSNHRYYSFITSFNY